MIQIGLGLFLHALEVRAVELGGVTGDLVLGASAQQLEDRLADRLAHDVPDGDIHTGNGGHADALAAPGVGGAIHALPQVFVVEGVLADDQRREVLIDDRLGDARGECHVAKPHQPVVGLDFHHRPAVEAEGAHRVALVPQLIHGVGAEVGSGGNGVAFPFEDAGSDLGDFHRIILVVDDVGADT